MLKLTEWSFILAPTENIPATCSLGKEDIPQTNCSFSNRGDGSSDGYNLPKISETNCQWYAFIWSKEKNGIIDSDADVLERTSGQTKDCIHNSRLDLFNVFHIWDGIEHSMHTLLSMPKQHQSNSLCKYWNGPFIF